MGYDEIREALAKRRAAVIPSGLRYAEIDPDLIEALLADNDRLRAVAEAARAASLEYGRTTGRIIPTMEVLRIELAALDAAND